MSLDKALSYFIKKNRSSVTKYRDSEGRNIIKINKLVLQFSFYCCNNFKCLAITVHKMQPSDGDNGQTEVSSGFVFYPLNMEP